ncbi:MAG TPA: SDR family oxidoreductase [Longimicrobiales bacterium]
MAFSADADAARSPRETSESRDGAHQAYAGALAGRTALVTGGSRGIGRATAAALVRAGARTIINARDARVLDEAARATGAEALPGDITAPAALDPDVKAGIVAQAIERLGGVPDILVNAAGAFSLGPIAETELAAFDTALSANLRAPFALTRALLPAMLERRRGHIVTIGSVAGRVAFPGNGAYSAGKFGVRGLHEVLAAELRGTGVRSTLIEPAATDTTLWDSIDLARNPGLPERSAMLSPDSVADAVLFALTRAPETAIRTIILERS